MDTNPDFQPPPPIAPGPSQRLPVFIIMIVLSLVALVGIIVFVRTNKASQSTRTAKQSSTKLDPLNPKAVEQVFINPSTGTKTPIVQSDYYSVMVGNNQYFGAVHKINADFISLTPTAYKQGTVLTFAGNELHGPESTSYFRVSKISKLQQLISANPADAAVIKLLKTAPPVSTVSGLSNIDNYIKNGQFQAYFFDDGSAFFAKTTSLSGNFLSEASHVYVLQSSAQSGPSGASPQVSLELAKPSQYSARTSATLLYWQNMRLDSKIAQAVAYFEKSNPVKD